MNSVDKEMDKTKPARDIDAELMKVVLLDYASDELFVLDRQMEKQPFQTSKAFDHKMNKMLRWRDGNVRKTLIMIRNTAACVAASFLLLILINEDVRANVIGFVKKEFTEYVNFSINEHVDDLQPYYKHNIGFVPQGYELYKAECDYGTEMYEYLSENDAITIVIMLNIDGTNINYDNSDIAWKTIKLDNGYFAELGTDQINSDSLILVWYSNGYIYSIYGDAITDDNIRNIADGISVTNEKIEF